MERRLGGKLAIKCCNPPAGLTLGENKVVGGDKVLERILLQIVDIAGCSKGRKGQ
jgi:hypothetical protein